MDVSTPNVDDTPTRRRNRRAHLRPKPRTLKVATALVLACALGATAIAIQLNSPGGGTANVKLAGASQATAGASYGTKFTPKVAGSVTGVLFYDAGSNSSNDVGSLWTSGGVLLGTARQSKDAGHGWRQVQFAAPVAVRPGTSYLVSVWSINQLSIRYKGARPGPATATRNQLQFAESYLAKGSGFPHQRLRTHRHRRMRNFHPVPLFAAGPGSTPTATPAPTAKPAPRPTTKAPVPSTPATVKPVPGAAPIRTGFPSAANTGVPAGVSLSPYSGSCTVTKAGTVIEAKTLNCSLVIKAANVTIVNSKINGIVDSDSNTNDASVTIKNSEVDGGQAFQATVSSHNVTIIGSNIHGGEHNVQCNSRCTITDSWLHGQYVPADGAWHLNAFISNGGTNMTLVHNTLSCDAKITRNDGGCTADASIFGDFEANSHFTFDHNLFVASTSLSYCAYAGYDPVKPYGKQATNIVYTNNVFQRGTNGKCGLYGPVTSFNGSLSGNVFRNNVWDDGTALNE